MSIKNAFFLKIGTSATLISLAALATIVGTGAAAVSQQPPTDPPLVGGFKIDYGDSLAGPPPDSNQPDKGDNRTADASPPAVPQQNLVPGLPSTALPMAFPAAAPPAGLSKGPPTLIQAGDMIGFSRELGDGVQAITIINASRRWMAVYHIDTSGQIRLTSSRPLDADFTIQFNATAPLPEDIRRLQGK